MPILILARILWHESFGNSYKNFLFGHPLAKERLIAIVASGDNTKIFPLYMLCYLFDNNELTLWPEADRHTKIRSFFSKKKHSNFAFLNKIKFIKYFELQIPLIS